MDQGWVYVLLNSSIPDMAKVGRTMRHPKDRAAELSSTTGVPTPFVVAFDQSFADCQMAERAIHDELDKRGLRVMPNREFFRGPVSDIIRVVQEASCLQDNGNLERSSRTRTESAGTLLLAAESHLFGLNDTLQDTAEALRFYKLAALRGSLLAFERLGQIYGRLWVAHPDLATRRRMLTPLKEGARRGNYFCYIEMAVLFAAERHTSNFTKVWTLFFATRSTHPLPEFEQGEDRMTAAACSYVGLCLDLGLMPEHRSTLLAHADAMIAALLAELDRMRANEAGRRRVIGVLRWTLQAMLPAPAEIAPICAPERQDHRLRLPVAA